MDDNGVLSLAVTVPAPELAGLQRRVRFLEAALLQLLRDGNRIKEWFSADELAALRLPGMPSSASGVARVARAQGWVVRRVPCVGGQRHVFHFSSLPRRAFEAVIDRIVKAPSPTSHFEAAMAPDIPAPPVPDPVEHDGRTVPQWVLPLMRIMRGRESVEEAVQELPRHLPAGMDCPTPAEAMRVLRGLGMAG